MAVRCLVLGLAMIGVLITVVILANIIFACFEIQLDQTTLIMIMGVCTLIGFGGSVISIIRSKSMVIKQMGVQIITTPRNSNEQWLVDTVTSLAKAKGVNTPDVGIYPADEMNAFATGWNRNDALVAVSTGLLNQMSQDEVEAVLGHEMSHVSNGDMVTMGLLQGVMNTFVYSLAYIVAAVLAKGATNRVGGGNLNYNRRSDSFAQYRTPDQYVGRSPMEMVFKAIFGLLASMVVMAFSRWREYHADAGSAQVYGSQSMIKALYALQNGGHKQFNTNSNSTQSGRMGGQGNYKRKDSYMNALYISVPAELSRLFASHPTIEQRVAALRKLP